MAVHDLRTTTMRKTNRYVEAFKENFNVVGLATTAALSAATLNPLPLLAGIVAEAVYLIFVPDSRWYDSRLSKRYDAEVEKRRQQLKDQVLPTLRPQMQQRFARLEQMRGQMNAQGVEGQTWFREVLRKLDYLLEKFLVFASKELQFCKYLRSVLDEVRSGRQGGLGVETAPAVRRRLRRLVANGQRSPRAAAPEEDSEERASERPVSGPVDMPPLDPTDQWIQQTVGEIEAHYDRDMSRIKELLGKESDVNTEAVLEKRLDVLQRRQEFVGKIGRILTNLHHQLELLEDTFGLINDEIRARSPEQILADIEDVVGQTDTMTKVLEEVAPYEHLVAQMTA